MRIKNRSEKKNEQRKENILPRLKLGEEEESKRGKKKTGKEGEMEKSADWLNQLRQSSKASYYYAGKSTPHIQKIPTVGMGEKGGGSSLP
ncbi:hypothetical protein NPIL_560251 [Nephila pilipes]|uniref:Uncharacterized protein n=1 Tax=Nephila pilipes TaxID=299642 RepID=A0A8X6IK98_NEPPI|nr:hypothetical protein NPIL_560251 [Nephila pilipes]